MRHSPLRVGVLEAPKRASNCLTTLPFSRVSVVTVVPVLLLFLVLQRHYLQGLLVGSVKG